MLVECERGIWKTLKKYSVLSVGLNFSANRFFSSQSFCKCILPQSNVSFAFILHPLTTLYLLWQFYISFEFN